MAKNKEVFRLSRSERKKIEKRRNQESDKRIFRAAKQVRQWITDNFGVKYSLTATKALLRRLGATYHRTTPFLFKADPEKQKKFAPLSAAETEGQFHPTLFPGWRASGVGR